EARLARGAADRGGELVRLLRHQRACRAGGLWRAQCGGGRGGGGGSWGAPDAWAAAVGEVAGGAGGAGGGGSGGAGGGGGGRVRARRRMPATSASRRVRAAATSPIAARWSGRASRGCCRG